MQLIEGQMFVFFYKIRIEIVRVRGSNKNGRDVFLAVS